MNTPTKVDPVELAVWNARNERARRSYEAHPIRYAGDTSTPSHGETEHPHM